VQAEQVSAVSDAVLTPEQLAALAKPGPWAWFVLLRDGFVAKLGDEGAARDFAAKNHGLLVPMVPLPPGWTLMKPITETEPPGPDPQD
jgi:hypothetical protein